VLSCPAGGAAGDLRVGEAAEVVEAKAPQVTELSRRLFRTMARATSPLTVGSVATAEAPFVAALSDSKRYPPVQGKRSSLLVDAWFFLMFVVKSKVNVPRL
jgi:hypothetical protein